MSGADELDRLRARVAELEPRAAMADGALEELEKIGWPCGLAELPAVYLQLCASVTELKSELTSYRDRLDLAERYHDEAEAERTAMRGKLAVAEAALVEIRDDPDVYHRQIAEDALEATGTREAAILRAAEEQERATHNPEWWEHEYQEACKRTCAAVRGEEVRDE